MSDDLDREPDHEFGFELRVCRWAEANWPPGEAATGGASAATVGDGADGDGTDAPQTHIVARQLGTKRRRWDTVVVEVDPAGLRRRAAFGAEALDGDLLHVVRDAPAEWAFYRDALPHPGYPWRYVREAIHRAADRGVVDTRRDGNRIEIRRIAPYPDWVERIVAVENKPDLDASAADALTDQLERDVARGLADEVWVATRTTGERVEPMLLEALPDAAGVLTLDFDARTPASVAWYPRSLSTRGPGIRVRDRSEWAVRFEYVDAAETAATRLEIAERAYGRGWRSYVDTMRPDCASFELRRAPTSAPPPSAGGAAPSTDGAVSPTDEAAPSTDGGAPSATDAALVPYCTAKGREPTAAECAHRCPEQSPEPPRWRERGWPIEGGPGARSRALLETRRRRRRPGIDEGDGAD